MNEDIKRALESAGVCNIEDVLLHKRTGLGLIIRKSVLGGWYSTTFKVNNPKQLTFAGKLIDISPDR